MADITQLIIDQNSKIEACKKDFTDATFAFAGLCHAEEAADITLKKEALLRLYQKAKVYFSFVENCIVEGCVAGAFDHSAWLDDMAGSAEKVLTGIPTLYGHFRKHRAECGFTPNTFEPSGNIFQNMQGLLALRYPDRAKALKQQFIDANLPHDWFDKPLKSKAEIAVKNNPWISGSFYLFCFVLIMLTLCVIAKWLYVWVIPFFVVAGLLLVTIIGALQLRNDDKIGEKDFLSLMKLAFQKLPLLEKLFQKHEPE
jgi:hypothetical protein